MKSPQTPNFKNIIQEKALYQNRLLLMLILLLLCALALIARLFYLQVLEHQHYTTLSKKNLLTIIPIEPNRGLIYDRHGVLLAKNVPVYSLEVYPHRIHHLHKVITEINQIIPLTALDKHLFQKALKQHRPYQPVALKLSLTPQQVATFYVNQYRFPGVMIKAHLIRNYPLADVTSQVVGYVGRIDASELAKVNSSNYSATNYIGKTGIEKYYEAQLHGKVGYEQVETDAAGHIVRVLSRTLPVPGNNLYLTIDAGLQQACEQAMHGKQGAVVAIQPNTGEILAMVSMPSFNPNIFVKGLSEKAYHQLSHSPFRPLFNRTIRGLYPTGSTIKPFIALGGLAMGIIHPYKKIWDPGWFKLPGSEHIFHDWQPGGHGWVDLTKAIIVSCDTYFFKLAPLIGIKKIDTILHTFGFGKRTQVDLPGELPGLVPTPKWKMGHIGHPWSAGDTENIIIGQGYFLASPLQLAVATATLAMRGEHFQPHLILKQQTADGSIQQQKPILLNRISLLASTWRLVIHAMQQVIMAPDGTGFRLGRNNPYDAAGKTGTAQVISLDQSNDFSVPVKYRDHSEFIVFAPRRHPKIALAVVIEHDPHAAVMVTKKILDYYFNEDKQNEQKTP